jgi:hypothetical protein
MKMVNILTEKVIDINYEAPDGMNALSVSSKMHLKSTPIDNVVLGRSRCCVENLMSPRRSKK